MNAPRTASDDAWAVFRRVYWTLAAAIAAVLLLLAVLGFGPGGRNCQPTVAAASDGAAVGVAARPSERPACLAG
jgi:hypothetical protein